MKYNLQSIESSMVEFMFGENISLDQLDYLKSVTQDIGADVVISSDTGFEGIACAQLYAIKEGMNYNKQNEKSKKFALKSLSNSYSYFNAIGVDLEVNCSDGVPYIERVKHIITNELNYSDSDYCSLFESEEKSYKEEFLGESSSVDKASTMLIKAEGTYRFLTSLEVDLSTSCKNGKTLDDYLSELINHIDSSINEGSSENPSGQYLSAGEEKFSNCSLTMDDIVDPNFACDTSKIISTLHQQLTRSIKDRGGESKKLFMNEIWGDSVWGEYPDLPNKECYFYAVTRYKDNKVMYDLKIRGNGVVYNISTKFEPVHYMKNYLQNLKMKKLNENRN
jgi:hypothetical protein